MAISKVIYGTNTLIDLTSDTIAAPKVLSGYTAHGANGEPITGSLQWRYGIQNTLLYLDRASVSSRNLFTPGTVTGTTLTL